jgi:hypothetical protein
MAAFTLPHSNAVPDPPQTTVPWIKNAFYWDFHSPKMTKTHIKNVRGADQKRPNFCFRYFPQISTLLEIPRETPWKIAENRTLKWGSSPLPCRGKIGRATVCKSFCDFLIDFGAKNRHSRIHALEACRGKILKISIYQRSTGFPFSPAAR